MPSRTQANESSTLAGAWFEARTASGPVRLYASGPARHAADAAVALARNEALLDALDAWTGLALDWRWIAAPAAVTATASHARALWRPQNPAAAGKKGGGCRLEIPWSMLRMLPAPEEALAACLQWAEVPVVLAIAQLAIPQEELALLEPGGAVVLPESMQSGWCGVLRALDDPGQPGAGVPVSLASPWTPRRVAVGQRAEVRTETGGDRVRYEVRLTVSHALPSDRLGGWFTGDLGEVGPGAGLWRCATEREPAYCLAAGALMPWGDGWALALQELYEIRQARH
jgi:hypothetical protein